VPARRRRLLQQHLALNGARLSERKRRDVPGHALLIRPRRGKQRAAGRRQRAHVRAVHVRDALQHERRHERPGAAGGHGTARRRVDRVLRQAVAVLHQRVQVRARGVDGDPARRVARPRRRHAAHRREQARCGILRVRPDAVGPHVCRVQVALGAVEGHAVDCGLGRVGVVLDVRLQRAGRVHREDVAEAGVLVERVAVHVIWRLLSGQKEDGSCAGGGFGGFG